MEKGKACVLRGTSGTINVRCSCNHFLEHDPKHSLAMKVWTTGGSERGFKEVASRTFLWWTNSAIDQHIISTKNRGSHDFDEL